MEPGSRRKDGLPEHGVTETLARGGGARSPLGAIVRVIDAEAEPREARLERGMLTIGSGDHNNIIIRDRAVSRSHVELHLVAGGVRVQDLGSRNGTFFSGQQVEGMVVALGSRLTIGRVTIAIDADTESLTDAWTPGQDGYAGIVGRSSAMQKIFSVIDRLRGSLASVLIEGPSGVGKELVARALHNTSPVAAGPFVAVNCAALVRDLVASELFGHQRGAFTGAGAPRKGAFLTADQGTLFLDEVGDLPLDIQPQLLRALELGEVRSVGSDSSRQVKVRVVAATNRDLRKAVESGAFREDLYFRLAVIRLVIPPLADRLDDIPLLARHFAADQGAQLPASVIDDLGRRPWQGNVRELRNAVQAYCVLGELPEPLLGRAEPFAVSLGRFATQELPYAQLKDELIQQFTRAYCAAVLQRTGDNQSAAARAAGLDRNYFARLLAKHGVQGSEPDGEG